MDVLLIFLFVFGVASYLIWSMYLYSQNTYGKYAPDKIQRTYHTTKWDYFTDIDTIAPISLLFCLFLFIYFVFKTDFSMPLEQILLILVLFALCFVTIGYASVYAIILIPNYWKHTKDVFITSLPEEKAVHIDIRGQAYMIENGDILDVHRISNINSRDQFGYAIYTLKDNRQFILTDKVSGTWILDHFFKKIPYRHTNTPFPIIK